MRNDIEYRPDWDSECFPEDRPCHKRPIIRDEEKDCCNFKRHPLPKKILLECGIHPQDAFFEVDHGCVKPHQSFILDKVVLDTNCFCKPLIKLEFSSLVVFEAKTFELPVKDQKDLCGKKINVELLFELIRVCDKDEETVQIWKFRKEFEIGYTDKLEVAISEPFTVTACDKVCPGCCIYKMKVFGKDFEGIIKELRVIKPNLSALAQDTACD